MNNDDIIASLLRTHDFRQIDQFVQTVRTDPRAIAHFTRCGATPEAAVSLARQYGYDFDLAALEAWIERAIAALAAARTPDQAAWLARRAEVPISRPADTGRDTRAVLHDFSWSPDFVLDRQAVLSGDVVVLRQCTPVGLLNRRILEHLGAAFGAGELTEVFTERDDEAMRRASTQAYRAFQKDKAVPDAMSALHQALGIAPEQALWEWPGFRLIPPLPRELGIYRDHHTGSVGPHRDTWYGSPHHQINLWTPLWPMARGAGVVVQTAWFQRAVANTSEGYDQWLNALGLALPPSPLIETAGKGEIAPHLEPGDLMIFAGQHLHRSGINRGPVARGSVEWRLLVEADRKQPWCPVNVDFRGRGEIAENWFDQHGRPSTPPG